MEEGIQNYTSPLDKETQAAVGRVVSAWAVVEHGLKIQIARLAATAPNQTKVEFNPLTFLSVAYYTGSGGFESMSKQLKNAAAPFGDELLETIRKATERLSEVKKHRDTLCHSIISNGGQGKITVMALSAARAKPWVEKSYSIAEMDGWCDKLLKNSLAIDTAVTSATGLTNSERNALINEYCNQTGEAN
ncbi:hypothetical protein C7U61_14665 [Rhizobium sp. JAB6]|uniref:hypothetical protein n=1 Tax=Rhizobium sp. JAB6 TaxID=2127050 RepID=UPI000D1216B3|nr:hypothetical protein [Rhizobium sp. JAB6]PST19730.1 hypothetical protein C7U61_14665 [Rhizobium sp. JAB6]